MRLSSFRRLGQASAAMCCFVLTAVYAVVAWAIVTSMRIGPVVAVIDEQAGRGVHSGDVLAIPLLLMAVATFAAGVALVHRGAVPVGVRHRLAHQVT